MNSARHFTNAPRTLYRSSTRPRREVALRLLQSRRLESSNYSSPSPSLPSSASPTSESTTAPPEDDGPISTPLESYDKRALWASLSDSEESLKSSVSRTEAKKTDEIDAVQLDVEHEGAAKKDVANEEDNTSTTAEETPRHHDRLVNNLKTLDHLYLNWVLTGLSKLMNSTPEEVQTKIHLPRPDLLDILPPFNKRSSRPPSPPPPSPSVAVPVLLKHLPKPQRKRKRKELRDIWDRFKSGSSVKDEELEDYIRHVESGDIELPTEISGSMYGSHLAGGVVGGRVKSGNEDLKGMRKIKGPEVQAKFMATRLQSWIHQGRGNGKSEMNAASHGSSWQTGWGKDELRPSYTEGAFECASNPIWEREASSVQKEVEEEEEQDKENGREGKKKREDVTMNPFGRKITSRLLKEIPFTKRPSPLLFTRRIEGIIEPDTIDEILETVESPSEQQPIARLNHNLERVLFNPGVHWLQDPRSRVYNFDPYIQEIPAVTDFAFERVEGFTPSSRDPDLQALLKKHNKRFSGSTSSLSGILCHLYFLISLDRLANTSMLSKTFALEASRRFTPSQRMPVTVVFRQCEEDAKDSGQSARRYCVDSLGGGGDSAKNILTWLGTMLEKFLTVPKETFEGYLKSKEDALMTEKDGRRQAFRFSKSNSFIMRSQLDCYDPRLPGSGVFDIKTRACVPIRLDIFNYEENSGYLIRRQYGKYESFEREYYDLIRSAFLKYQFQVRVGNMDGVIVAYHNTKRMFGFQYIPLEELDDRLFGPGTGVGDRVFKGCISMLENVAEEVVNCFPNQDVRATFETLENTGVMKVWVEPTQWDEISYGVRPMKQIEVRTWSYLNSESAKSWEAFCDMDNKWTIRWSIAHVNMSSEEARENYLLAKQRQLRAWTLPTGIDPDDMKEWYESLNFGGETEATVGSSFRPEDFVVQPDWGIQRLRELARQGREDTERMREEEAGKPVYVLGEDIIA
ncbi:hypothetical protein AN958_07676 [Leucoagaricus sp. SymC.cos]|nr:hypothetical protein AN958_07676 [Leucoagaricus sp. SymC.cos]